MTAKQLPQGQTRGHRSSTLDKPVNQVECHTAGAPVQLEEVLKEILAIKRLVTATPCTTPTVAPKRDATTLDANAIRLDRLGWEVSKTLRVFGYRDDSIDIPQFVRDARKRREGAVGT